MPKQKVIELLRSSETIPGLKILQPWAGQFFQRTDGKQPKNYEIRRYNNKYRGWVGMIASGWDSYFGKNPLTKHCYCLLGFCNLILTKQYSSLAEFKQDYIYHKNPPEFYVANCYAWIFRDSVPIKPLYYQHRKNRHKSPILPLIGQHTRCRIATKELLEKVIFL